MKILSSRELFIVADGRHFVLLAKNSSTTGHHLKAFKRVDYDREMYSSISRGNSGKVFD